MVFKDRPRAERELARIGFYRLKGYIHPFRKNSSPDQDSPDSTLRTGTSFEQVLAVYEFDRDLRAAVLRGLERVEVCLRAMLTEGLTAGGDSFAHRDGKLLGAVVSEYGTMVFDPKKWLAELDENVEKEKHESFIEYFRSHYTNSPEVPCWMALQMSSFGELSRIYKGCNSLIRDKIAVALNVDEEVLGSWLHALGDVRNFCAHHGRLWNRSFNVRVKILTGPNRAAFWNQMPRNRLFIRLAIIRHLLPRMNDDGEWVEMFDAKFLNDFSQDWYKLRMGFPFRWKDNKKVLIDWSTHPAWTGVYPGKKNT